MHIGKLEHELNVAKARIEELEQCNKTVNVYQIKAKDTIDGLEAYNRQDNLIIAGFLSVNYAKAASGGSSVSPEIRENSVSTEQAVYVYQFHQRSVKTVCLLNRLFMFISFTRDP